MIYKNQPFLFLNNDNKECLFYCEAEKTITLNFGNDYEITPWKVALTIDGVKTDIELPKLLSEFGDIVIECNPHIIVENESPVFYYVAGFLLGKGFPIIYYLCSLETDWQFKEFKNLKIIKKTFSGTIINNEIISIGHFNKLIVGDIVYDSFEGIQQIYRIIPIYQNKDYFLITASINKVDISIVVKSDLSLYCVLKNKENVNIYKSTILKNKIVYTVKNANNGLAEDRSLVTEEFLNDIESNLIPTNIKKSKLELSRAKAIAETKSKALAYAAAELAHATQGPASEADAAARLAICVACPDRAVEYKGMTDTENGVGWCTRCGCGSSPRALLTVKITLAGYECPLKKWSAVPGTGATVASAVDAVAGVAKSIIHKLSS